MDNITLVKQVQSGLSDSLEILITQNEKLIWSIVHRFTARYEAEDLFQIGCIGMIKAAQKFDFDKGVMFSTYAVPVIIGEIQRFLRDDGIIKISRTIKSNAAKVAAASEKYTQKNGQAPSISVLENMLGLSSEEIVEAIGACGAALPLEGGGDDELSLIDTISSGNAFDEEIAEKLALRSAAESLPEREKKLISLRYFHSKTQAETAKILDVSQAQVSRLEKSALKKMRAMLV